ncbi:MAG: PilN domain-containing protein [Methylococcales bacterium]
MLNLNSTIDLDFKKFLRWWGRELSFLVPEKIKHLVNEKQGVIIIRPVSDQFELSYVLGEHTESLGMIARNESGQERFKMLLADDERLSKAQTVLRLTNQQVIEKELGLPSVAKENLHQVVGYELDRYTPFKAEEVYYAVKPVPDVVNEPGQIRVNLLLTTRSVLDDIYKEVKALGCSPLFVDFEEDANDFSQRGDYYNLLPYWLREKTAKSSQLLHAALVATVLLLLGTALVLPLWFQYQTVNVLQAKIDEIEPEAKKIKALQLEIDNIIEKTKKLIAEKNAAPQVVTVLNALSELIKDDTWLAYAQYSEGQLQIQGESPTAATLIAALEDSEYFADARFVSPVTQDKVSGLERFQIAVNVTKADATDAADSAEEPEDPENTDDAEQQNDNNEPQ